MSQKEEHTPLSKSSTAPGRTVSHMLGEITWLMSQSPVHKQMFIGDLEWFAMPAIALEQYRVFYGPEHPAGVALWARVTDETDQALQRGATRLRADQWKGGQHGWLMEMIAPFGGQDEMLLDLGRSIFPTEPFKFHYTDAQGQRKVQTFRHHLTEQEKDGQSQSL